MDGRTFVHRAESFDVCRLRVAVLFKTRIEVAVVGEVEYAGAAHAVAAQIGFESRS